MFNSLASYLLGTTSAEVVPSVAAEVRLTSVIGDDDWVLIDRSGSAGESDEDVTSIESLGCDEEDAPRVITRTSSCSSLPRSSSCSSIPCTSIEESWFMTPPPCFTSAGPIHMETSPLENLLIEHPSMSVYHQHSGGVTSLRHHNLTTKTTTTSTSPSDLSDDDDDLVDVAVEVEVLRPDDITQTNPIAAVVVRPTVLPRPRSRPPHNRHHVDPVRLQQQRQCLNVKNAQKVQIQKACQTLKKSYLERTNKARDVNFRNRRQRRGERSQGATRSNANNNRKC